MSNTTSSAFRNFPMQVGKVGETITNPTVEEYLEKETPEVETPIVDETIKEETPVVEEKE